MAAAARAAAREPLAQVAGRLVGPLDSSFTSTWCGARQLWRRAIIFSGPSRRANKQKRSKKWDAVRLFVAAAAAPLECCGGARRGRSESPETGADG